MTDLAHIKKPIEAELERFDELFQEALLTTNPILNKVLTYLNQSSGKMMRPMLLFLTAKLLGEVPDKAYHAAISLHLLHNASLVHDDVVDESDERRGRPSLRAAFTNQIAVLSGDYLLSTALYEASQAKDLRIIEVVSRLGKTLASGELLQMSNVDEENFSETAYFEIIKKKTASLFAACTETAALAAGAADDVVEDLRRLGLFVGLAFQIRDDIFDYFDDEARIGKPTGNDMREGKLTLPVLYLLNSEGDERLRQLGLKVKKQIAGADEIAELVALTKERGGIDYAYEVMRGYKELALQILAPYPESEAKEGLRLFLDYMITRDR